MLKTIINLLPGVDYKRVTIITLSIGVCILYAYIHEQNVQLATTRLVYTHPRQSINKSKRKEIGEVRIVTRYIERPSGEKETTIEEVRGAVIETEITDQKNEPVPISETLMPARMDRYLLTIGVNRFSSDFDGKALFVGYGFKNRMDIQIGGIERNGFSPWLLATIRF